MHKKAIGLLIAISFYFLGLGTVGAATEDLYNEPMTIKLIPSSNFNTTLHGDYKLIDKEDGEEISIKDDLQFRYEEDGVTVKILDEDESITSSDGFTLQEELPSSSNYVSISSVNRAGASFRTTEYRGSFSIEPGEEPTSDNEVPRLTLYNILELEDYLKGVVPKEMLPSWPKEALKAQAVAARNYAKVNMDANDFLYDTTAHQVYHGLSGEDSQSNAAINETAGLYATYNGSPIYAFFHASSGGHTDNSENVWSNKVPYIRAVEDPYDTHSDNPHTSWTHSVSRNDADEAIFPDSKWELSSLEILEKSNAGRVQKMKATAVNTESGEEQVKYLPESSPDTLRSALGTRLKSTKYDMEEKSAGVTIKTADGSEKQYENAMGMKMRHKNGTDEIISYDNLAVRTPGGIEYISTAPSSFEFKGKGWGHGLGMSQWGAYKMAEDGKTFREILKHYYTGIEIEKK